MQRRSLFLRAFFGTAFAFAAINNAAAADKIAKDTSAKPFIYFATSDPFLKSGQQPTKNDVTLLGGAFTTDTAGGALRVFTSDYTSNYIIGATYGRDVFDLGAGFLLGGVAGAAIRFGEDDDTSAEV